jgi:hypothetical protein
MNKQTYFDILPEELIVIIFLSELELLSNSN